jgi:hypothetical protein
LSGEGIIPFIYEDALRSGLVDAVILGEGEATFEELLKELEDHTSLEHLDHIAGLAFIRDGAVVTTLREPLRRRKTCRLLTTRWWMCRSILKPFTNAGRCFISMGQKVARFRVLFAITPRTTTANIANALLTMCSKKLIPW